MEERTVDESEVARELGRLSEAVRSLVARFDRLEQYHIDTRARVHSLERWRAYLAGAVGVIGALVGWMTRK